MMGRCETLFAATIREPSRPQLNKLGECSTKYGVFLLMKARTDSLDAKSLSWFIDLLNAERRPESPRIAVGKRLPTPGKKIRRKINSWLRREAVRLPEQLRSLVASHMAEIITQLN